jgi:hypothetical protein
VIFGETTCPTFRLKMVPKTYRPKSRFIKSIPAGMRRSGDPVAHPCPSIGPPEPREQSNPILLDRFRWF